jgi:hypothetical protein
MAWQVSGPPSGVKSLSHQLPSASLISPEPPSRCSSSGCDISLSSLFLRDNSQQLSTLAVCFLDLYAVIAM